MHTTYTFKKNGKAYSAKANNRFEAQEQIELAFGISLKGATFEEVRLIKVGKGLHYIDEERQITEKATGVKHPEAGWLVDVERA